MVMKVVTAIRHKERIEEISVGNYQEVMDLLNNMFLFS